MTYFRQFLFLFISVSILSSQNVESFLSNNSDIKFKNIKTPKNYTSAFELTINQFIDHENPDMGTFQQRVFYNHKSSDRPTVIVTEGYTASSNYVSELAKLLNANQLIVEHRYFGKSLPQKEGYDYLNLKQATSDYHNINQIFREIYPEKWVSTGISKGGMTTILYRYYYPDDIDVSIPYVAPVNKEFEEKRIYSFLDSIGSTECRNKLKQIQTRLLKNREQVLKHIKWYSKGASLQFTYMSMEEAFEYAVLELPFSFWQWGGKCEEIPSDESDMEADLEYLINVAGISLFADHLIKYYQPHYYQAATEGGYYGYRTSRFKNLIKALPLDKNPHAAFLPKGMKVEFNKTLNLKVHEWLAENGNQFIYIYGANDTWSASGIKPTKDIDALWFYLKDKHHGTARIKNMTVKNKELLTKKLYEWLDL